ncbi:uncharacterized protein V6R79_023745 [Siganus canaliculatus]
MACGDADMDIHGEEDEGEPGCREPLRTWCYQPSEIVPTNKRPLHHLLKKQPAVLGSLQMVSGLLSFGVGLIFASTQQINDSLLTMFRASHLTGLLVSLMVNCGCIIVAVVAVCLISVDLALQNTKHDEHYKMEVLELCVLGLEVVLSAILCFWFSKEKHFKSP